jgi:hypothetical protein
MRTSSFKLTASLLALASAAVPAAADDAKNYPGAACLATGAAITRSSVLRPGARPTSGPAS